MALATQNSNLVWQKVKIALLNASPAAQEGFAALKAYLAQQKGNPDLQFVPFSAEQIVTNGGFSPDVDAARVYGIWVKGRRTSGTTASFVAIHDATDNSATTTTVETFKFNLTGQQYFTINPDGFLLGTELTVSAATAVGGATESSAADAADGFVIVGGA